MKILNNALDLVVPKCCKVCGRISNFDSSSIRKTYMQIFGEEADINICSECIGKLVPEDEDRRWFLCLSEPIEDDSHPELSLFMPFRYKDVAGKIEPVIKFGKERTLARLLGIILGDVMRREGLCASMVVPVPLSERRLNERGFNQASEMAFPIARMLEIPFQNNVLIRTRDTKRQNRINDSRLRANNVSGAFAVNKNWDVSNQVIILVDDVATTGFTLHEAAIKLYEEGASQVLCVAFSGNRQLKNSESF